MKRLICLMAGCLMGAGVLAQGLPTKEEVKRSLLETFYGRDASVEAQQPGVPLRRADGPTAKGEGKSTGVGALPAQRWFPGEWEEVQAIVLTCWYEHLVPGHETDYTWSATPALDGKGYYRHYVNGQWRDEGFGPYVSVPDTSTSGFPVIFFHLMDAVQTGNAEAWVRVENAADSSIILRQLQRMGLRSDRMRFLSGPGNAMWFRDCGPICFYYGEEDSIGMVDFAYYPNRVLDDSLPALIERQTGLPNYTCTLEWEGGNCLTDGAGMVLSSDAIYGKNLDNYGPMTWDGENPETIEYSYKPALTQEEVRDTLAYIMGPRGAHIVPALRYAGSTGHLDLYCDMIDENEFVFSKFPERYNHWADYTIASQNMDTLCGYDSWAGETFRRRYLPFPRANGGGFFPNQNSYNNYYTRSYSNHTFVNNVIIQPCFTPVVDGQPSEAWDRANIDSVRAAYPGYTIYPVDVSALDGSGGAIHCVTKQIPADNPVHILHVPLTGNTGDQFADAPVMARISNRSGIASAQVVYRIAGGDWQERELTTGADGDWNGSIGTAGLATGSKVEYYIRATSNNGKTITKPLTAGQGGHYSFYTGQAPVGIDGAEGPHIGQFYPNPATGQASIWLATPDESRYEVRVVDMSGRTVWRGETSGSGAFSINTEGFPAGGYLVVFRNNDEQVVRRLVVRKWF